MGFYDNMTATALRQINDKGRTVTLRKPSAGTYVPGTDTYTAASADYSAKAVITSVNSGEIDGTIILAGDKRVLLAASALAVVPAINDIVLDGTEQLRVINVEAVKPGDTAILYKLQVRK